MTRFECIVPQGWECSFIHTPTNELWSAAVVLGLSFGSVAVAVAIFLIAWYVGKRLDR